MLDRASDASQDRARRGAGRRSRRRPCSSCCSPATSCCGRCARRWASRAASKICSGCSPPRSLPRSSRCRCSGGSHRRCRGGRSWRGRMGSSSSTCCASPSLFFRNADDLWAARTFYVWLSVFNLLAISLAWSVLVDLLAVPEAKRLFAIIAAGASLGGLAGPVLGTLLVAPIGHSGTAWACRRYLLGGSAALAEFLHRWRDRNPVDHDRRSRRARSRWAATFRWRNGRFPLRLSHDDRAVRRAAGGRDDISLFRTSPSREGDVSRQGAADAGFRPDRHRRAVPDAGRAGATDRPHRDALRHRRAARLCSADHGGGFSVAGRGAGVRRACVRDDRAPRRRICAGAAGPRNAVHGRAS